MRPTHWLWIHRTMTAPFSYVCSWTSQSLCAWELAGKNNRLFPIYLLYISTNITHAPSSKRVRKVQGCCACLKMALVSVSVGNRKVLTFSYSLAILKHSKWFSQQIKNFCVYLWTQHWSVHWPRCQSLTLTPFQASLEALGKVTVEMPRMHKLSNNIALSPRVLNFRFLLLHCTVHTDTQANVLTLHFSPVRLRGIPVSRSSISLVSAERTRK